MSTDSPRPFDSLGLSEPIMQALADVGYESPSPIQQASIPPLLEGKDLLGQAQTGTGKTAAFALPLLSRIDLSRKTPQFLVLAPTRELAIQVAEAMQSYARHIKGFHVLPIYGGQPYDHQLRQLRRGVQVVVGTPGRVMDHIRRGTLKLDNLDALVLDEADEMLRMGFIDDVEWILEQTPQTRQIALFSATMPSIIRKVAQRHLNDPTEIKIAAKTSTAKTIRQRYWQVSGLHKLDALTRILECESFDAMLVFVRTKIATVELAEKLEARGYASEALNGDIPQKQRERTVERFKAGRLDILVATDVAARGLDVERISHVINYDIPYDTESYVHRIGRTGRAGRTGDAILFVSPKERRLLRTIERATRQPIERMQMPSAGDINEKRMQRFKDRISDALAGDDLDLYYQIVSAVQQESDADPLDVAAAVARLLQGDEPLLLVDKPHKRERPERSERQRDTRERDFDKPRQREPRFEKPISAEPKPLKEFPEIEMVRYRIEVGYQHEVKPGNIVGAIANEADIESSYIGHIEIHDDFSTIDLPEGMPKEILQLLRKVRVCGQKLEIAPFRIGGGAEKPPRKPKPNFKRGSKIRKDQRGNRDKKPRKPKKS
ncbi:DEAD/DEAH box helicase [endosymbiont of Ridgeia piscesae]|uniref:ATP-dependent RNA helicase DeaD n=1 Tax=endosymbiont of Ridgeia piscesae TaxID=54398 RepID=A0A0T5YWT7_9GAMM|nr:DEAD/DEAH box helicase [endosymbiont of Ridgeia piscesae]KRT55108.1 ATP-dependent RNA helicase CsdA [endosymbiont of Ridgeia piscesae]KRT59057.1 ATP-dependent RNA helicase CsdA [endosymbiont of Ridgeia piscesae]